MHSSISSLSSLLRTSSLAPYVATSSMLVLLHGTNHPAPFSTTTALPPIPLRVVEPWHNRSYVCLVWLTAHGHVASRFLSWHLRPPASLLLPSSTARSTHHEEAQRGATHIVPQREVHKIRLELWLIAQCYLALRLQLVPWSPIGHKAPPNSMVVVGSKQQCLHRSTERRGGR